MPMSTCDCGAAWSGTKIEHCTVCHKSFSSTAPGDMHRTGEHGVTEGPNRRRCRTTEEMLELRDKHGQPRLAARPNKYGTEIWGKTGEKLSHLDADGLTGRPWYAGRGAA